MNNKCVNLRIRTKKGIKYFFCVRRKDVVEQKDCSGCLYREFKKTSKIAQKTRIRTISKKHKVTKATAIPTKVKKLVWERDNHRCIFCQKEVEWNYANSHYIKRSQLGMGIEQNIMTNCTKCHELFEETEFRERMKNFAKDYFMSKYDDWKEEDLIYKKYA